MVTQLVLTAGCGPSAQEIERQRVLSQGREIISALDVSCSQGADYQEFSEKSQKVLAFLQANGATLGAVNPTKLLEAIDVTLKMWDTHLNQPTSKELLSLNESERVQAIRPVIDAQVAVYSMANNGRVPDEEEVGLKAQGFDTSIVVAKGLTLVSQGCAELLEQLQPAK